jgi:hypothetical protein
MLGENIDLSKVEFMSEFRLCRNMVSDYID